jgi:hypothetical protein
MYRLRILAAATCVLAIALIARAQEGADLKAILKKAITAHGGEKEITKYKAAISKFKGKMNIATLEADIVGETSLQRPDKVKNVMSLDIGGKKIDIVTVFNGKKLWVSTMGQTKEIDDENIINAAREEMKAEASANLTDYLKAPYELSALGEVKVKGKDAIGIRVSTKGQKDISFFFDKKTHLMLKSEMRSLDAMSGQEVTQEKFITEYQVKNGIPHAKRVEILKDGKVFMDIEITETTPLEKLDDTVFAMP